MRILVTGSSGFIGRALTAVLASQGHDLLLLSNEPGEPTAPGRRVVAEIGRPDTYARELADFAPESCVHLAWAGIPDFSRGVCTRNLSDAVAFVDALVAAGSCRRLVVSGTCLEYGQTQGPCVETSPVTATSYFTWAKLALLSYAGVACAEAGLSLRWLRVFYAYGPGQRGASLLPTIASELLAGREPAIAEPNNSNDFVYVDDVAEAFATAACTDVPSGVYNVGTGHATPVHEMVAAVERSVRGTDELARRMAEGSSPPKVDFRADTEKSGSVLGWRASTSLADGVRRYLDWRTGG